jgi:hypothetical protein
MFIQSNTKLDDIIGRSKDKNKCFLLFILYYERLCHFRFSDQGKTRRTVNTEENSFVKT